jgi:hypothetical protein
MPLRDPNNPNPDIVVMSTVKSIMLPNTQLALSSQSGTGQELVFIQEKYKMYLTLKQDTPTSAINMSSGLQEHVPEGQFAFSATLDINVEYCSKWSGQFEELDDIWKNAAADLERMKANIQENDDTHYGGTNHTIGLAKLVLSPYEGLLDDTFPGLSLIKRTMTLSYNIMPY